MTFDDIIKNRRSIRHFKPDPLTKDQIQAILEAGNEAPSAKNGQQWRFHVYTGEAKEKFAKFCLDEFEKIIDEPWANKWAKNSLKIQDEAPVIIVVFCCENKLNHPSRPDIQSISAAIQNMLLKAEEMGIGSLWICDILYIEKPVMKYHNTDEQLLATVTFGYSSKTPQGPKKKPVKELTTWHE
ncbi:MAG: nitroreductase family protein [Candidatus Heimdallarchaeota archaeon]